MIQEYRYNMTYKMNHVDIPLFPYQCSIYDKFSKVVVDFSSIRGQKLFGWMLIFNLF